MTRLSFIKGKTPQLNLFYELLKNKAAKAKRLLSYSYTSTNYHYFIDVRERGYDYKVAKDTTVDDWLIIPDGSLYRPFSLRFQNDSTTREKVQRVLNKQTEAGRHRKISFKETFVNLIDYILESGTQIVFFLPPYHPRYYQRFKKERPCIVAKIEAMLRSLARSRKIPVIGSYDPGSFNLSSRDFIDHAHARDYVVEKIFKEYQEVTRK